MRKKNGLGQNPLTVKRDLIDQTRNHLFQHYEADKGDFIVYCAKYRRSASDPSKFEIDELTSYGTMEHPLPLLNVAMTLIQQLSERTNKSTSEVMEYISNNLSQLQGKKETADVQEKS